MTVTSPITLIHHHWLDAEREILVFDPTPKEDEPPKYSELEPTAPEEFPVDFTHLYNNKAIEKRHLRPNRQVDYKQLAKGQVNMISSTETIMPPEPEDKQPLFTTQWYDSTKTFEGDAKQLAHSIYAKGVANVIRSVSEQALELDEMPSPHNYQETISGPHSAEWAAALQHELKSLAERNWYTIFSEQDQKDPSKRRIKSKS